MPATRKCADRTGTGAVTEARVTSQIPAAVLAVDPSVGLVGGANAWVTEAPVRFAVGAHVWYCSGEMRMIRTS
jgi:hypothetical protein